MTALKAHEPTTEELTLAREAFEVVLISFSRKLERLEPSDFLARYHRLKFKIRCRAAFISRPLFLTVRRNGSKIAGDNFYTVPFFAEEMPIGADVEYELLSFDSFNLPFESLSVELCRHEDYLKRRVSPQHIEQAKKFATLKKANQSPDPTAPSRRGSA